MQGLRTTCQIVLYVYDALKFMCKSTVQDLNEFSVMQRL